MDSDDCSNAANCGPGWRSWTAEVDWTEREADDSVSVQIRCGGVLKASSGACTSALFDRRQQVCAATYDAENGDGAVSCGVVIEQGNPIVGECRLAEPPRPLPLASALLDDAGAAADTLAAASEDAPGWLGALLQDPLA